MTIDPNLFRLTTTELNARVDVPADVKAEVARQWLYAEASDCYKEVYGIRCRWMHNATSAELIAFIDDLRAQARAEQDREIADEQAHVAAYSRAMQPSIRWSIGQVFPCVSLAPNSPNFENSDIAFLCR